MITKPTWAELLGLGNRNSCSMNPSASSSKILIFFWNFEIVKTNVSISSEGVCFHSSYLCTIKGQKFHFALVGGFSPSRWASIGQLTSDCLYNSRFKPLRYWDVNVKVSFFSGLNWTNIQAANILRKVKYLLYWSILSLCVKPPTTH